MLGDFWVDCTPSPPFFAPISCSWRSVARLLFQRPVSSLIFSSAACNSTICARCSDASWSGCCATGCRPPCSRRLPLRAGASPRCGAGRARAGRRDRPACEHAATQCRSSCRLLGRPSPAHGRCSSPAPGDTRRRTPRAGRERTRPPTARRCCTRRRSCACVPSRAAWAPRKPRCPLWHLDLPGPPQAAHHVVAHTGVQHEQTSASGDAAASATVSAALPT